MFDDLPTTRLIDFEVPGKPVAWQRPKQAHSGRRFTDPMVLSYQAQVANAAAEAMDGRPPVSGPVALTVTAVLPIPVSWPNWKKYAARVGTFQPTARPDFDNFLKGTADALNGIAFKDDAQVVDGTVRKVFGERPRLVVSIETVAQAQSPKRVRTMNTPASRDTAAGD